MSSISRRPYGKPIRARFTSSLDGGVGEAWHGGTPQPSPTQHCPLGCPLSFWKARQRPGRLASQPAELPALLEQGGWPRGGAPLAGCTSGSASLATCAPGPRPPNTKGSDDPACERPRWNPCTASNPTGDPTPGRKGPCSHDPKRLSFLLQTAPHAPGFGGEGAFVSSSGNDPWLQ